MYIMCTFCKYYLNNKYTMSGFDCMYVTKVLNKVTVNLPFSSRQIFLQLSLTSSFNTTDLNCITITPVYLHLLKFSLVPPYKYPEPLTNLQLMFSVLLCSFSRSEV